MKNLDLSTIEPIKCVGIEPYKPGTPEPEPHNIALYADRTRPINGGVFIYIAHETGGYQKVLLKSEDASRLGDLLIESAKAEAVAN